ncbi:MAG: hypothetical protein ACO3JL_07130, partial [Myxococcota bacterium]
MSRRQDATFAWSVADRFRENLSSGMRPNALHPRAIAQPIFVGAEVPSAKTVPCARTIQEGRMAHRDFGTNHGRTWGSPAMWGLLWCLVGCTSVAEVSGAEEPGEDTGAAAGPREGGSTGERDAGVDAGRDAGQDPGSDAGSSVDRDAGADAGSDISADAGGDDDASPAPLRETTLLYVPIGPAATCNRFNPSACEIFAVTFDTSAHSASGITSVVSEPCSFSPAVSPDGTKIAFDQVIGNRLEVNVRDLTSGVLLPLRQGDKSHWQGDNALLFGVADELPDPTDRWTDVGRVELSGTPLAWDGDTERLLGSSPWFVGGASSPNCSAEDPFVHPASSNLIAFHNSPYRAGLGEMHTCPWMTGIRNFDYKNPQPVVVNASATSWQEGVSFWRFDLSELPSPLPSSATPPPTGCA